MKRFKKMKLIGNSASIVFASGGLASSIATGGVSLVAISTAALLIQGWMKHQSLDMKIQNCQYAYQSYSHLLILIKDAMRSGMINREILINSMNNIDNYVADNSPVVDKFMTKYNNNYLIE